MRIARLFCAAALVAITTASASADDTGELTIQFQYEGDAFDAALVNVTQDKDFCGPKKPIVERLLVNKKNKGVKNVVVYVYTGRRGGTKLDREFLKNAAPKTHELANKNCRFEPHILVARKGDTVKVTNPDEVGHNCNLNFIANDPDNFTVAAGASKDVLLKDAEPAPIPVDCNIHPWMKSYMVVTEHPFVGVSDEDGKLTIKGLPTGKIVFRAYHEAGSMKEVIIDGKKEDWKLARFEVKIKPGQNDMGTVVIPKAALSAE